jgi:hypothetical protein
MSVSCSGSKLSVTSICAVATPEQNAAKTIKDNKKRIFIIHKLFRKGIKDLKYNY